MDSCLADNEIYSETSKLAINNYALGYQDFFGFPGRSKKTFPIAPENERYMRGWFAAKMASLPNADRINPLYSTVRNVKSKAKAIVKEWEELAEVKGWKKEFPI